MVKHCPICNRTSDKFTFYGEFCSECTKKDIVAKVNKDIEITRCKRCGRIRIPSMFAPPDGDGVEAIINRQIKPYRFKLGEVVGNRAEGMVIDDSKRAEADYGFEISFKDTLCERCARLASGYYEAVFQLRGGRKKVDAMAGRIERYFEHYLEFISRITDVDNGTDVYVSSKTMATSFVKRNRLKPTMSYTLWGLKNGKKFYRNTYAIRLD